MRGICYVAWGEKHIKEACFSARQNKSGYPTCLITDPESMNLALDELFGPDYSLAMLEQHFNQIVRVDFRPFDAMEKNPPAPHGFWRKQAALKFTPFNATCFLDTDCIPVGNLDLGFELAEEGNFCNVIAPTMWFKWQDKSYVLYNGGVWFFKSPAEHITEAFRALIPTVGKDYWGDEGVISVACRQGTFKHAVLPKSFNLPLAGHNVDEQIRIVHSRTLIGFPPRRITTDYMGHEVIER